MDDRAAAQLAAAAAALGLPPAPAGIAPFLEYLALLQRWNRTAGLVAEAPPTTWLVRHVLDCWALGRLGPFAGQLVDVGSGAGLPGLILALTTPALQVTLVESQQRKCAFLREAVHVLGLAERVTVTPMRVEQLPPGGFDTAVSRATFAPTEWLVRARPLLRPGGAVLVLLARAERAVVLAAAREAGYLLDREDAFALPDGHGARLNLRFVRRVPGSPAPQDARP